MAGRLLVLVTIWLLGGFLGMLLVRSAPGYGADERELDPRLAAESIAALRAERAARDGLITGYARYLAGLAQGDLGVSQSLGRPVAELLGERFPRTLGTMAAGLAGAWAAGLALALSTHFIRLPVYALAATLASGLFVCLPSAVLALACAFAGAPPAAVIAAVLFPRVFRYAQNLLERARASPHILLARAKGLNGARVFWRHVLPVAAPHLISLTGVTLSMAFAASIPVEVFCDSPGVGQLAWQAALGRDLPVLVNLTLLMAAVTLAANFVADMVLRRWHSGAA